MDPSAAPVQHVGIDHGRTHIRVTKQLLDRADIAAVFQQMGGKGMANISERRGWGR